MRQTVLILIGAALCSCVAEPATSQGQQYAHPELALEWRVGGLANPESVALSADGRYLYVTNVNGEADARDGNGFISRVSMDGRMLEREWARGLNGPKGMALAGDVLYVADIDRVVVIDASSGAIRAAISIPDARFLNDIAVLPDGVVLVADSARGVITALEGMAVTLWSNDPLLDSVNGLLVEQSRVVVTTMSGRLLAIDLASRAVSVLADGLGDGDGVAALDGGRYLVSQWPGLIHVVDARGQNEIIVDTREETRYMNDFIRVGEKLFVPHWEPSELSAYEVKSRTP